MHKYWLQERGYLIVIFMLIGVLRRYGRLLRLSTVSRQNLHVAPAGCPVIPCCLNVSRIFGTCTLIVVVQRCGLMRTIRRDSHHVVHIKDRTGTFRFYQRDGEFFCEANSKLEQDIRPMVREAGHNKVSSQ
jgi:hypothetical protein